MVAAFYSWRLFFKAIIVTSVKSLANSPDSYMVLISFVNIFKPGDVLKLLGEGGLRQRTKNYFK